MNIDVTKQPDDEHTIFVQCPACQGLRKQASSSSAVSYVKCRTCDGLGGWWERPKKNIYTSRHRASPLA
jgi:hypothetical protein